MSKIVGVSILRTYNDREVHFHLNSPYRHSDVYRILCPISAENEQFQDTQGFILEDGRFVDRYEALLIAEANDQIIQKTEPKDRLFSEDLW